MFIQTWFFLIEKKKWAFRKMELANPYLTREVLETILRHIMRFLTGLLI